MIVTAFFYIFAAILVASAGMVVAARNPVHAVLFLILAFFNAAGLFLIAGAEFLAMILVIVYVGAVAVLFLFVVMMLDIRFDQMREGLQRYAPIGAAVGLVLFAELVATLAGLKIAPVEAAAPAASGLTNSAELGLVIYTRYIFLFQACGIVLLVAMIGAIVLTLRERVSSRKQDIAVQHARHPADTLVMADPVAGSGMDGQILRAPGWTPALDKPAPARLETTL